MSDALPPALQLLLREQEGVVSRRQVLDAGLDCHDIERLLRRRCWARLWRGVYVDHTGAPTWEQRCHGAVLALWPAALHGVTAIAAASRASGRAGDPIHVAIDRSRRSPAPLPGVVVHHVSHLHHSVHWQASPPRRRHDDSVLDVALDSADELDAVAVLAEACSSRRTTAARLQRALADRARVPQRRWFESVLRDIEQGTHSVLEHGFLTLVERPHGLPRARRQRQADGSSGVVYRDAAYGEQVVVELDGRLFHGSARARDLDLERDLDHATTGGATVRLGWRQVYRRPCSTAVKVARFLEVHGVTVALCRCGPTCGIT